MFMSAINRFLHMSGRGIPINTFGKHTVMECFFQKSVRAGRPHKKKLKGARPKKRSERQHQAMVKEKIDGATDAEDLLARSRVKKQEHPRRTPTLELCSQPQWMNGILYHSRSGA